MVGRPTIFEKPMSGAERQRRVRAKARAAQLPHLDQMVVAIGRAVIDEGRENGINDTLKRIVERAAKNLEAKQFDVRRTTQEITKLMKGGGEE